MKKHKNMIWAAFVFALAIVSVEAKVTKAALLSLSPVDKVVTDVTEPDLSGFATTNDLAAVWATANDAAQLAQDAGTPFVVCTVDGANIVGAKLGAVNFIDLAALNAVTRIVDLSVQFEGFSGKTWFVVKSTAANSISRKISIRNGGTVLLEIQAINGTAFAEIVVSDGVVVGTDASGKYVSGIYYNMSSSRMIPDMTGSVSLDIGIYKDISSGAVLEWGKRYSAVFSHIPPSSQTFAITTSTSTPTSISDIEIIFQNYRPTSLGLSVTINGKSITIPTSEGDMANSAIISVRIIRTPTSTIIASITNLRTGAVSVVNL